MNDELTLEQLPYWCASAVVLPRRPHLRPHLRPHPRKLPVKRIGRPTTKQHEQGDLTFFLPLFTGALFVVAFFAGADAAFLPLAVGFFGAGSDSSSDPDPIASKSIVIESADSSSEPARAFPFMK